MVAIICIPTYKEKMLVLVLERITFKLLVKSSLKTQMMVGRYCRRYCLFSVSLLCIDITNVTEAL